MSDQDKLEQASAYGKAIQEIKMIIDKDQRLMRAMQLLMQVILEENGEWNANFLANDTKVQVCYCRISKQLVPEHYVFVEPLSYLPYCNLESFWRVKARITQEHLDLIYEEPVEKEDG